jgi:hypothetical protein
MTMKPAFFRTPSARLPEFTPGRVLTLAVHHEAKARLTKRVGRR